MNTTKKTDAPVANAKRRKTQEDGKRRKDDDVPAELQEKLKAMDSPQLSSYCHRLLINSQGNSKEYEYAYMLLIQQPRKTKTIAEVLERYMNDPDIRKQDEDDQEDATGSNTSEEDEEEEDEEEETEDEESVDLTDEVDAVKEDDVVGVDVVKEEDVVGVDAADVVESDTTKV